MASSVVFAASVGVALGSASSGPSAPGHASVYCHSVTGAQWHFAGRTGKHYLVNASGVSCSLIRQWIPALTKQTVTTSSFKLKGPKGWSCTADRPPKRMNAFAGGCNNTAKASSHFVWNPGP